ncbi:hypothetical protein EIP86_000889 [Pleurotus ostreatoroseus]|nr:hypothetical protein EIP86_000889 [Pleurotus ostreatoroseus]
MPEFQGGSLDPWGGAGYDGCEVLTGPDYEDVFYKQNWASNVKMISYYMFYGGTSWGAIAYPGVYTSYDYGSAIRESRTLSPKLDEMKRQGLFLRSSPEFRKTDWIGDSSTGIPGVTTNNSAAFVTLLRNPDSGAGFYIVRQNDSTSTERISFHLTVNVSDGAMTIPRQLSDGITLNGRQSKVIVTDFSFGHSNKLLYSTANILFAGVIGNRDVIFLYSDLDEGSEFALGSTTVDIPANSFAPGVQALLVPNTVHDPLVLFADTGTASSFWSPVLPSYGDFSSYWQFGSNNTVLVGGPYLVRNATVSRSGNLALRGDLNDSTSLTLVIPDDVHSVSWNGDPVHIVRVEGVPGMFTGNLHLKVDPKTIKIPALTNWKYKDSLPEVQPTFDDSIWTTADHTTTNITQPLFGDGRILYAFAASIWLNDRFIATTSPGTSAEQTNGLYAFPKGAVKLGQDNVLTIVQDHMGIDEDGGANGESSPRGIPGFKLTGSNFTTWKVQGKLGGYTE